MYYNCPSLFHQTDNIAHRDPTDDGGDPARTGEAWLCALPSKRKGKVFFSTSSLLGLRKLLCVYGEWPICIFKKKGKEKKIKNGPPLLYGKRGSSLQSLIIKMFFLSMVIFIYSIVMIRGCSMRRFLSLFSHFSFR